MIKFTSLLVLTFIVFLSSAFAEDQTKKACLKEAKQDWQQANKEADFELRASNYTCRFGVEVGACMSNCLPALRECLHPVYDSLKSCRKDCSDALIAARRAARETLGCGTSCNVNADFQKAVIQANLVYQSCRITCRSSTNSVDARAGCRTAHGLCVNACK